MALSALDMMKGWVEELTFKNRVLEEENKSLKLTIVRLTQELEMERLSNGRNSVNNVETHVVEVSQSPGPRRKVQSQSDMNMNNGQQFPRVPIDTVNASQRGEILEKSGMSCSFMSISSEGDGSSSDELPLKEEPVDEFITDNPVTETPAMDEEINIDVKDEDLDYGHVKSKSCVDNINHDPTRIGLSVDESLEAPIKHESERSIQRMFRSPQKVSHTNPASEGFGIEVGTTQDHEDTSSSYLTKELLCPKLAKPEVQVSTQKVAYLTTRPAETIHCDICSATFDTQFKLRQHKKSHTGKKTISPNPKTTFKCSVCEKNFSTKRVLTNHMKTHTGGKPPTSLEVDDKGSSVKRSLTVEGEKVRSRGRPKKQRKIETGAEACNDDVMSEKRERNDLPLLPCVDERNPFKTEKILGIILSYLGKHDLLNARMVSHAWNDESLKVLRNSEFTQVLGGWNINDYILFARLSKPRPFIIPFHLDFTIELSTRPFRHFDPIILTSHVKSLCQTFGQHCVSTLTLSTGDMDHTEEDITEIDLCKLFSLISRGLKIMDMAHTDFRNDFLKSQIIQFPNLNKLICNTHYCESGRSGSGLTYISIIENSPKLEDLTLTHYCDLESWPLKFNQLKSLSLDTMFEPQNILDKILASSGPPVLRELSLRFDVFEDTNIEDNIVVHNILKSVSSTLKSLKFRKSSFSRNSEDCEDSQIMRFPKLPYLEHLGLEYNLGYYEHWKIPEVMKLSQETFPSLKSIELPIGFNFTECQEDDERRIEFPNLTKLILRVGDVTTTPGHGQGHRRCGLKGALKHLQKIFPTPSIFSFVNAGGDDFVVYVLSRIMKSDWSINIQEIGMIGFREDYLGVVLETWPGSIHIHSTKANESDSFKMINITTIKLEHIKAFGGSYYDRNTPHSSSTAPKPKLTIPNLTRLAKPFPQLRMIEVSGLLLFHQRDKSIWRKHSLEFKSKFPDIVLNVI